MDKLQSLCRIVLSYGIKLKEVVFKIWQCCSLTLVEHFYKLWTFQSCVSFVYCNNSGRAAQLNSAFWTSNESHFFVVVGRHERAKDCCGNCQRTWKVS